MTVEEVYAYFKTQYQISKQLGISAQTPRNWKRQGFIPFRAQAAIEKFTNGALKLDINHGVPANKE